MKTILHIDMNSYFASVEQQSNPKLRGKPIGVMGGDRMERTVLSTASVEAKKLGVKTGMPIWEARRICPQLILVCSNHEKYLSVTKRFLDVFKSYTPYLEVFSIDECFLELDDRKGKIIDVAREIKSRLRTEIGERITCSVGISYNKLMAKLAGSLQKPDGLVVIPDQKAAIEILDKVQLDDVCGIGSKIKHKLFNMGITNFKTLRQVPRGCLLASFKSYGEVLYSMARGIDYSPVVPFYDKEEVKSVGHRHTLDRDTGNPQEIKRVLFKISEMIAAKLRSKHLLGKTIHCWYRSGFWEGLGFNGDGMQQTLGHHTFEGKDIFQTAWQIFHKVWDGKKIRMVGTAVSNLKPSTHANLLLLEEDRKRDKITLAVDQINNKFGDFTIQRGIL